MDIISSKNVINIIRKTLNLIDSRLIHHGDRVGYIILKMLQYDKKYNEDEIRAFVMTSVFHDIGAYKIEELDKMVQFETDSVENHSIYGYLFYKYLSPLDDIAQLILYHHLDYNLLKNYKCQFEDVATYLNLADRIDVMTFISNNSLNLKYLKKYAGSKYSAYALELFEKANQEYKIVENIKSGDYIKELLLVLENVHFSLPQKEKFLEMLIFSIDFRSEYTVMHTITTVSVADEIGKRMGLLEKDRRNLHFGALLHDVGKVTTPIEILESTGRLSDEEMKIMRNHVVMSEYILKDYIEPEILNIAIRHHEKMDGTGYPKKLKGENLTLPERILAVSDIISALAGKRSYKEAYSREKIKLILMNDCDRGKLCRQVIHYVTKHLDEILNAVEKATKNPLSIYQNINERFEEIYARFTA